MSTFDDLGQRSVKIAVSYYNEDERSKLLKYPTAAAIDAAVASGVTVSGAQFLTYYLFHRRRPGLRGFRTLQDLQSKIGTAVAHLDGHVRFVDGSLAWVAEAAPLDRAITEHIAEAAALSVVGHVHGLHEGDWDSVPPAPGPAGVPTFDFEQNEATASDGQRIVQVEAKGSAVVDAATICARIRNQKADIDKKKSKIAALERGDRYPHPADLRYGIVCALGQTSPMRCWLSDPPAEGGPLATRYRLLARLQFVRDLIAFLMRRSPLAATMVTRVGALSVLRDPFELADVPLLRATGEPFEVGLPFGPLGRGRGPFAHLCHVTDGPAVGTVLHVSPGTLFFVGIQKSLIEIAASQAFSRILEYRDQGGSVSKTVRCVLPRGRATRMGLTELNDRGDRQGQYVTFNASGMLHYSQGGMVFGLLRPSSGAGLG